MAEPMVVVDNLHVVYRVYGSGMDKGTAATALLRMVRRQRRPSIREVHAIRGMSFIAYKVVAVGVIGRNGSGKSTLLRAIAGLLPAEQGMVYTFGDAALLGVNAALLDNLTGERNVILGCLAMGMSPRTVKERYQSIVDFSGVGDFINLAMKTYSTGMGSRLRFAIASAKSQDILLVDEALATGDAEFRVKSHQRIDELREHAGTVFLVAHNLNEIEETCNKVIWLEKGRIVQAGENVLEIIDAYLAATGGEPRVREPSHPVTGSSRQLPGRAASARRSCRLILGPPPGRDDAATSPSCARASCRTMYRPSPMPPNRRRSPVSPWTNRSKIRS